MAVKVGIARALARLAAAAAIGLLLGASAALPAAAHGKELAIKVTSLAPDPERPLSRLYRVTVVYAGDRDPVSGAEVVLTGTRQEGGAGVGPTPLTAVESRPGLYVGEITYARFGTWRVRLTVSAALGQGEGETEFIDEVRPGGLTPAAEAALKAEGERVRKLQLFFRFDWWPDVVNILVRIVHALAGLSYFVVTGAVLVLAWLGLPAGRLEFSLRLRRAFLPLATGSLGLLLASGLYSAVFSAPIAPPGLFNLAAIRRMPYGDAYLAAFLVKPFIFLVLVGLAMRIHHTLRSAWWLWRIGGASAGAGAAPVATPASLRRLTLLNAAVGLLAAADTALITYLHYVTHLAVFLPAS